MLPKDVSPSFISWLNGWIAPFLWHHTGLWESENEEKEQWKYKGAIERAFVAWNDWFFDINPWLQIGPKLGVLLNSNLIVLHQAQLLHLRASFRAQCVQLPLRTQDKHSHGTGSRRHNIKHTQCWGLRPVIFFFFFFFCSNWLLWQQFFGYMNESRRSSWTFQRWLGALLVRGQVGSTREEGGRVWTSPITMDSSSSSKVSPRPLP